MKNYKKYLNEVILFLIILLSLGWLLKGCGISESIIYPIDDNYIKYEQKLNSLNNITVYVTSYGQHYHRYYHYINRNYPIPLGDCILKDYTPCMVCNPIRVNFGKYNPPIHLFALVIITWFAGFFMLYILYILHTKEVAKTYTHISNKIFFFNKGFIKE
ncbi:MAG TPA: hypothetical protein PKE38_11065 [Ignavibacteriaceae bacterium]|nr:hypothetical protein [Ignavibacteriaceae bacterium]